MEQQINQSKISTVVLVVLLIAVIAYLGYYFLFKGTLKTELETMQSEQMMSEQLTVEEIKKIEVPEPGKNVSENVAVPKESVQAGPETDSKLRIFELKGEKGQLSPNDFRAYQNDIINIKLTAVDNNYDFSLDGYNIQVKASKGETKTIEFQALNFGIYNFYCSLCNTKNNPAGKVVVVPK
jgi:heme/copper-type cytochrome/quinol oxidase subunit 2